MRVKIQNLSNRPVLLRLNSGQTLHIDPRKTSEEVLDVEIERNAKASKLVARRVIALREMGKDARAPADSKERDARAPAGSKDSKARTPAGSRRKKAKSAEEENDGLVPFHDDFDIIG